MKERNWWDQAGNPTWAATDVPHLGSEVKLRTHKCMSHASLEGAWLYDAWLAHFDNFLTYWPDRKERESKLYAIRRRNKSPCAPNQPKAWAKQHNIEGPEHPAPQQDPLCSTAAKKTTELQPRCPHSSCTAAVSKQFMNIPDWRQGPDLAAASFLARTPPGLAALHQVSHCHAASALAGGLRSLGWHHGTPPAAWPCLGCHGKHQQPPV